MELVVGKLVRYAEANMELSKYDAAKLRYMLEVIFLNTMEFVLFAIFFAYIGRMTEFLIVIGVLMSVRLFSGGFHFKKYRYCVILSFAIFAAVILVLPDVSVMHGMMEALLLLSILLNIALAPVSKRNFAHSKKSNLVMKAISTAIFLVYAVRLLSARDNPYASIITWMLFIQAVQLIIGKILILREKRKQ
ncbi:MAG: accessory gene regulator B family protein [Defluviitaleaceae bacterium]|nr:accessory gene regulator B family protein [Defluviitaleaceae bacterium]